MQKTAQERGFLNRLREKTNLSGKALEAISPEFARMMENLRTTDEQIRSQAKDIRNVVKWTRTLVNRRDYLSAAVNLSVFHEKCRHIAFDLEECVSKVDLKHYQFLLDQFDDEYKGKLFSYDPEKKIETKEKVFAKSKNFLLAKYADDDDNFLALPMSDLADDLTKSKYRAMRAFEKKFSVGFLKKLKEHSNSITVKTENFLAYLLSTFKKLATALATRSAQEYISAAKDFIKNFALYHKAFVEYYNENIIPLKKHHEETLQKQEEEKARLLEEEAAKSRENTEPRVPNGFPGARRLRDQDHDIVMPATPKPDNDNILNQLERAHGPADKPKSVVLSPDSKAPPVIMPGDDEPEDTVVNKGIAPRPFNPYKPSKAANHLNFVSQLEKIANTSNLQEIADAILKYAATIEEHNETDALKLIAIAEGIVDNNFAKDPNQTDKDPPKTKAKKEKQDAPTKADLPDPLALNPPPARPTPVDHGIPEGQVNQKYFSIPFLKNIPAESIRITPNAGAHIANTFVKRLFDLNLDEPNLSPDVDQKILIELRKSIVRGIVLTSSKTEDLSNPRDRYIEVYTYMNLPSIDRKLRGIAKLKIWCRLSVFTGILSVRTIQKNFKVE